MKTLDDVKRAAELADKRSRLNRELTGARVRRLQSPAAAGQRVSETEAFGVSLDDDLMGKLRLVVIAELQARIQAVETELRELGVTLPGDPVPVLEPVVSIRGAPTQREVEVGHPVILPRSWDRKEGTFTVAVPCDPATSVRWLDGGLVQVDEALNPRGLSDGPIGTPVIDRTEGVEARVGTVTGWGFRHDGIELRVRLERPWDKVRDAIEAGRLHLVGVGYEIRNEEIVSRPGQRPLADVLRWSLKEIRLHRVTAQAEAA